MIARPVETWSLSAPGLALPGGGLPLAPDAGLLEVLAASRFRQYAALLDAAAEAPEGRLKALVPVDDYLYHGR